MAAQPAERLRSYTPMRRAARDGEGDRHSFDCAGSPLISALREVERLRKQAGILSCQLDGIGPTGGFCMRADVEHEGPGLRTSAINSCLPKKLAASLAAVWANKSVLDLGCGVGHWGRYLRTAQPSARWLGLDGSEQIEEVTSGHVRFADLSIGLPPFVRFGRERWDWAMALEVAEHVPRSSEAAFMHSLVSLQPRRVLLSWARLGQFGHFHVNCQTNSYVRCAMGLLGWKSNEALTEKLRKIVRMHPHWRNLTQAERNTEVCPWLASTLMVFEADRKTRSGDNRIALPQYASSSFRDEYEQRTAEGCGYVRDGCKSRPAAAAASSCSSSAARTTRPG